MSATSIFVRNLHYDITEEMLRQKFSVTGEVRAIELQKNKRCACIYFGNHHDAKNALKMNNDVLKGLPLQVNWNVRDPAIQKARNANIILKNLDKSIDEKTLRHICTRFGKITSAKIASDENGSKGYAYVNYESEEQAMNAILNLNGHKFGKKKVVAEKYKPASERPSTSKTTDQRSGRTWSENSGDYTEDDSRAQLFSIDRRSSNQSSSNSRSSFSTEYSRERRASYSYQCFEDLSDDEDEEEVEDFQLHYFNYTFVEKSPTIIDWKQKYLQSMLCGKYKRYCNFRINRSFDNKGVKGRLAAVNNEVILVTTSEAAHIDCCKLLDEMIFCTSLKIPDGLIEDDIIVESLSAIIKPHKLKYLALQLDKQSGTLHIASFFNGDIEKGKQVVEEYIESFLDKSVFACSEDTAMLILKHCSWEQIKLQQVKRGVKLVGESSNVVAALRELRSHRFTTNDVRFQAGKLSAFFSGDKWLKLSKKLEKEQKCSIATQQVNVKTATPEPALPSKIQFEVQKGDIVDAATDAIVNGVSNDFDLSWGKISPAILKKAGSKLQVRCSSAPLLSSCLKVTKGYNLTCQRVFHLVTPSSCGELTKRVKIVLEEAQKLGMNSISFPTLGAGGIGLEPQAVALAMSGAFQEFAEENTLINQSIKKIVVVVFDNSLVPVFQQHAIPLDYVSNNFELRDSQLSFGCDEEEWSVRVAGFQSLSVKTVVRCLDLLKSRIMLEQTIADVNITKFEDAERHEIRELAKDHGVEVKVILNDKKSPKLTISGLEQNVKVVERQISSILHDLIEASMVAQVCVWKQEVSPGIFNPFPLRISRIIATSYEKSPTSKFTVPMCGELYSIDLKNMTYYSDKKAGNISRETASASGSVVPAEWGSMDGATVKRVPLAPGSTEYEDVVKKFNASGPSYVTIQKIERIQNTYLYYEYQVKKKDVEAHMKTKEPVERELFHGTAADDAKRICIDGFDRGYAGKNATAYGKGTYFAVSSSYSYQYCRSDSSGSKCMFLALVLTGNYCLGQSSYVSPPPMGFGDEMRKYDSVVNNTSSPTIFVVFKDSSMYPMYLITFR